MSARGLPTSNTSIVMLAWTPRSEVSSWSWLDVDPIRGVPAEPRPKRELSSGGAVSADDARRRELRGRAALAAARLQWERGGGVAQLPRPCRERESQRLGLGG
jgi:hypothetical protein